MIDYDHSRNAHSIAGARHALLSIFARKTPASLLDVGCGFGTWLAAARGMGVRDLMGLDGVALPAERLLVPSECIAQQDLTRKWDLGRRFDVVLCLEVAEHLAAEHAALLVDRLVAHSDHIVFSAACPGQAGQHHVNCQWPVYWQQLFNARGYVCSDGLRWKIWDDGQVEPWYRQNLFEARKEPARAGRESRLPSVIHPELIESFVGTAVSGMMADGVFPVRLLIRAIGASLRRRFNRRIE